MKKPLSLISVAPALRTLTAIVCLLLSSLVCMAQMPDSSAGDAAYLPGNPTRVSFSDGSYTKNVYFASGAKLKTEHLLRPVNAVTSAMDYATEEDDGPSAYAYDNLLNFLVTLRYS